jgi:hypothetical protein
MRFTIFFCMCSNQLPTDIVEELKENRFDDSRIKQIGIRLCVKMCRALLEVCEHLNIFYPPTGSPLSAVAMTIIKMCIDNVKAFFSHLEAGFSSVL